MESTNPDKNEDIEELQHTDKERPSANHDLEMVNRNLQNKVAELSRANSDLENLMEATEVGTLLIDSEFKIRRFTQSATDVFNLTASDINRPFEDVTHRLEYKEIQDDVRQVLDSHQIVKKVVKNVDGHQYMMRMHPYRLDKDEIERVVITFVDVTKLKETEEHLAERIRQQEMLAELGLYALAGKNAQAVIHRALQIICEMLTIDYGLLLEHKPEKNTLQLIDSGALGDECPEGIEIEMDPKWDAVAAFNQKESLIVNDFPGQNTYQPLSFLNNPEIISSLSVKVEGTHETFGVLVAYTKKKRKFSEHDTHFLQAIANLMGESQERDRREKELKKVNNRLEKEIKRSREYQKEILHNSIIERWNLGGYLHDDLAQILVSIKIILSNIRDKFSHKDEDTASNITRVLEYIDEGINGIRNLTRQIIPVDIQEEGITQALKLLIRDLQKMHNIRCSLKTDDIVEKIKDRQLATHFYHIIQEAIKNAAVHGEAENIHVVMERDRENLLLHITDDGKGLSKTALISEEAGSGINIMQHRIELLGGSFSIEGITGSGKRGTRITCTLPLKYLNLSNEEDNEGFDLSHLE